MGNAISNYFIGDEELRTVDDPYDPYNPYDWIRPYEEPKQSIFAMIPPQYLLYHLVQYQNSFDDTIV